MTAWQSHGEDCTCPGCEAELSFLRSIQELESDEPTPPSRIWPWVKELAAWVAVVGLVLLMVRCGQ